MLGANGDRGLGLIIGGRVLAGLGVGAASNMVPIVSSSTCIFLLWFLTSSAVHVRLSNTTEIPRMLQDTMELY